MLIQVLGGLIVAIVSALAGAAIAQLRSVNPIRREFAAHQVGTTRELALLDGRVTNLTRELKEHRRQYNRRMDRLTVALGHSELIEGDE